MLAFRALTSKSCPSLVRIHTSARWSGARVAVVLSGCGVYDGTEIHEASARRASSMSEMLLRKPSAIDGMSSSLSTNYEDKVHPCIDLVDSLRSLGVEKDLNLSAIASIGDQSLGKRIKMV